MFHFALALFLSSILLSSENSSLKGRGKPPAFSVQEYIDDRIEFLASHFAPRSQQAASVLRQRVIGVQDGRLFFMGDEGPISELDLLTEIDKEMLKRGLVQRRTTFDPSVFGIDCQRVLEEDP